MSEHQEIALREFRSEKDKFFLHDQRSPLPKEKRSIFTGLAYYPFAEDLRFESVLETDLSRQETMLLTTNGDERPFVRWGWLSLSIESTVVRLAVFASLGEETPEELFLPFRDATSGTETYGAGRYVNVPLMGNNAFVDFNMAYNPYCAYGSAFSCALPPRENWIAAEIRAGEREQSDQE